MTEDGDLGKAYLHILFIIHGILDVFIVHALKWAYLIDSLH